jgi:hypothetical protein
VDTINPFPDMWFTGRQMSKVGVEIPKFL